MAIRPHRYVLHLLSNLRNLSRIYAPYDKSPPVQYSFLKQLFSTPFHQPFCEPGGENGHVDQSSPNGINQSLPS